MIKLDLTPKKLNSNIAHNLKDYFQGKTAGELIKEIFVLILLTLIFGVLISPSFFAAQSEHKVGTVAVDDIKADRDFLVEEKLATATKKSDILRLTPGIFDYDPDLSYSLQAKTIQLFAIIAEEITQPPGSKGKLQDGLVEGKQEYINRIRKHFEDYFDVRMTDEEIRVLYRDNFSSTGARAIGKLIDQIYSDTYVTNHAFEQTDLERGIVVRNTKTQEEFLTINFGNYVHVQALEKFIKGKAEKVMPQYNKDFRRAAVAFVQKITKPNLTFDSEATDKKKQEAIQSIKPSYFQVLKNEMIVREGEKITEPIKDKLDAYYKAREGKSRLGAIASFFGVTLIALLLGIACIPAIRKWKPKTQELKTIMLFLATLVLVQFILIRFGLIISDAVARAFPVLIPQDCFYAIPYVVGAMLATVLINDRIAVIFSVFVSFLLGFLFDDRVIMPIFSMAGSIFVIYQIYFTKQRSAFFVAGLLLGAINSVIIFAITLESKAPLDWIFLVKSLMGFIGGMASGIIAAGFLPLFESFFKLTTDIKLLELGNLNQPIFQRMIIETPGTYHHSIIVASLAESAAEAIGANALLAKVSAYYHDVGKLVKPHYFIENQPVGENKHENLSPKMSSLIIISHVKDGCDFARQLNLGSRIIDIIRQHHGTSLVTYFYNKAKKHSDTTFNNLSDSDFRYPGPKPQTKEAGLVMLSDVIEASSRTLDDPTPSRINNLVHERIEKIFLDGQLDECELTLKDLHKIAESFIRILTGIFHHRINYPDQTDSQEMRMVKETPL